MIFVILLAIAFISNAALLIASPIGLMDYMTLNDFGVFIETFQFSPIWVIANGILAVAALAAFVLKK